MPSRSKNDKVHRRQTRNYLKNRRIAREVAALAKEQEEASMTESEKKIEIGVEQTGEIVPVTEADVDCDDTAQSIDDNNDTTLTLQSTTSDRHRYKVDKRKIEALRRRQKRTVEEVDDLKKMVALLSQKVEALEESLDKERAEKEQLKMWREQMHDAVDFLLWERTGKNPGAYKSKTMDVWSELEDFHRFYD